MSRQYAVVHISPDPVQDAERFAAELDELEKRYPICVVCGKRIHDDEVFYDDGYYCEECVHKLFYVDMDRVIEEVCE